MPGQKISRGFYGQRGFTLVELLMAMTFFSAMLILISSGFIQVVRIYQTAVITKNAQNTTRSVFEQISRDARDGDTIAVAPAPLPAGVAKCFNVGSTWYAQTNSYELWRVPGSNGCVPGSSGSYLLHEDNLSVYYFNINPVAGKSGGAANSLVVDMTIGVINPTANEIVDVSDPANPQCQTSPILLRLCSVVEMHTAIALRDQPV